MDAPRPSLGCVPQALPPRVLSPAPRVRSEFLESPPPKRKEKREEKKGEEGNSHQGAARHTPPLPSTPPCHPPFPLPRVEGVCLPQGPRQSLVEGVISNPRPSFRLCPRPTSASPAPSVSQLGSPSPHGRQSCVCYRSLAPQVPTRARYSVPGLVIKYPSAWRDGRRGWLQRTRTPQATST